MTGPPPHLNGRPLKFFAASLKKYFLKFFVNKIIKCGSRNTDNLFASFDKNKDEDWSGKDCRLCVLNNLLKKIF